jgi:hypothetical protein
VQVWNKEKGDHNGNGNLQFDVQLLFSALQLQMR